MNRAGSLLFLGTALLSLQGRADGYIGTYTGRAGESTASAGIYRFTWDAHRGQIDDLAAAASAINPSFLVMHPNGRFLYAVRETSEAQVSAFAVQPDGNLEALNSMPSRGRGACHLALDPRGRFLFVAHYGSGSLTVLPVAADGRLQEAIQVIDHQDGSQRTSHVHQTVISRDGHYVLSVDLGLDKIYVYRLDVSTGMLSASESAVFDAPAGSGPRHLVFSNDGSRAYLVTELSAELLTLDWDSQRGVLRQRASISLLPPYYNGEKSGAEVALDPRGRWLFASSRGTADDIATFALERDGTPRLVGHQPAGGRTPRFITLDPGGKYLLAAAQNSDAITVFRIGHGGMLELRGRVSVPAPVDILWP